MPLIARVRPGQGLGAPRMADPHVMALLERTMGFRPVPGTLNVMLPGAFTRGSETEYIPASLLSLDWQAATGQAGYWLTPVLVAGLHQGVAVQADEPTGNLDSTMSGDVLALLRRFNRERGQTLVLVTHDSEVGAV